MDTLTKWPDCFTIEEADASGPEATLLLNELNQVLEQITGCSGASGFDCSDACGPRACFLISRVNGTPVGCGALRPYGESDCEIKRLYARPNSYGAGSKLLASLELRAKQFGYRRVLLETRAINQNAVSFYLKNGYSRLPNYGKYAARSEAACFFKAL